MAKLTSQSSATAMARRPKRRVPREVLLQMRAALNDVLGDPLPANLPPSPPASRSASPAPALKRKADGIPTQETTKRPRTSSVSNRAQNATQRQSTAPAASSAPNHHVRASGSSVSLPKRLEPREDGEVCEEPVAPSAPHSIPTSSSSTANVPIRRPKRGNSNPRYYDELHDRYHSAGRKLKYSGDARFWSTYPPTHKEYRPLPDPPLPNSPYHKHGGIIAKLELVNALICFTYALWCKDFKTRTCNCDTWKTIEGFLLWCRSKWADVEHSSEKERAIFGLICMMESFIHARKAAYICKKQADMELNPLMQKALLDVAAAIAGQKSMEAHPVATGLKASSTPQMLPSPASIAPANSANSTPTSRDGHTPSINGDPPPVVAQIVDPGPPVPHYLLPPPFSQYGHPVPSQISAAANTVTIPFSLQVLGIVRDMTTYQKTAGIAITASQQYLTLPIMARSFPRTFARMISSTLNANEEYEPDIEDDDGELLWPSQSANGEGLGWVCLMGQAMVREFGKPYGFKGLAGVVPKPEVPEEGSTPPPIPLPHGLPARPARPQGTTR